MDERWWSKDRFDYFVAGIGYIAAREIAHMGGHVIIACRNMGKADATSGGAKGGYGGRGYSLEEDYIKLCAENHNVLTKGSKSTKEGESLYLSGHVTGVEYHRISPNISYYCCSTKGTDTSTI
ncbi:hypothetical protein LOTGIDRAFT_174873 [Lottia gigantea]|uniref:Uncharacterized protein n=1 Tax=Lottia gigantea TaxID=225164 RepID=V4ANN2_LOTGI|nr:hypothetical protein LOTGIDRAFT_174873 [Lottia gigantea]ESO96350.1 hypothetical protein LOTGIDRAFT_174873 [Lottia gigantea]